MVKISIALPNRSEITLEAEDFEQLRPGVELVRQDLIVALASLTTPSNGSNGIATQGEKSNAEGKTDVPPSPRSQPPSRANVPSTPSRTPEEPAEGPAGDQVSDSSDANNAGVPPELSDPRLTRDFTVFCRAADPMGDMRKVVAAAEGARRYLNMDSVDAWELGHLFDLAGWTRPRNFTQTLRNSARKSFRWLERVPGRSGRYTTTEKGRSVALGGTAPS